MYNRMGTCAPIYRRIIHFNKNESGWTVGDTEGIIIPLPHVWNTYSDSSFPEENKG